MAKDAKKNAPKKSKISSDDDVEFDNDEYVEGEDDKEVAPETPPSGAAEGEQAPPTSSPSHTVTIEGTGTMPLIGKGGIVRTFARGEPIQVSDEELAHLTETGLPFKKGKK